ncbi:MAG: hypothetical protein ACRD2T_00340 [Thermoanaerobaculia bacterium]
MSRFDENITSRIALFHGLVSREQLDECLLAERARAGKGDLGQILLEKGYLSEAQVERIREIRRKKARKSLRDNKEIERSERSFGQIALQRRMVDLNGLERALLEQERLRRLNLQFRLGEVMVALGLLPVERVLDILDEQKRRILLCSACDEHYSVTDYRPGGSYPCKKCGGPLNEALFLDTVAVDGMFEPPRPGNQREETSLF